MEAYTKQQIAQGLDALFDAYTNNFKNGYMTKAELKSKTITLMAVADQLGVIKEYGDATAGE